MSTTATKLALAYHRHAEIMPTNQFAGSIHTGPDLVYAFSKQNVKVLYKWEGRGWRE